MSKNSMVAVIERKELVAKLGRHPERDEIINALRELIMAYIEAFEYEEVYISIFSVVSYGTGRSGVITLRFTSKALAVIQKYGGESITATGLPAKYRRKVMLALIKFILRIKDSRELTIKELTEICDYKIPSLKRFIKTIDTVIEAIRRYYKVEYKYVIKKTNPERKRWRVDDVIRIERISRVGN